MTQRDRAELARLGAELSADVAYLEERVEALKGWSSRVADPAQVLIPAALPHHFYTGVETFLTRLALTFEGSEPGGA